MMLAKPFKTLLKRAGRFFFGDIGDGWRIVDMKSGRAAAKTMRMLDGTLSCAGTGKGFIIIYAQKDEKRNFDSLSPMHVLLETSVENLSRFYAPAQAQEIYSAYNRFNRIRRESGR